MYASSSSSSYAKNLLLPIVEAEVKKRPYVKLPSNKQMIQALKEILEDADE